ncbi:MAG: L,D-transpeptidase [Anaerolineales bacterium]|nr:L,D-transpeptidase [Anaerolineales bacterium]
MVKQSINRRDFLKLGALALSSLAFNTFPEPQDEYPYMAANLGRITVDWRAAIYQEPREHSGVVRWTRQDEILNLYYELTPPTGPAYNPLWYRVWGGYIHSAYVQKVRYRFNSLLATVPESGQLAEVTLPYTPAYRYTSRDGWQPLYQLYYETTHWITGLDTGPDGKPWYQLTSEIDDYLQYYVPASHLRPIPDDEIAPISPEVPFADKLIRVSLTRQSLTCYEGERPVFGARISSGLGNRIVPEGTRTPTGQFNITSKTPSKHMGSIQASGAPDSYILPGVPWTSFFILETGVAFHGTFWHNNFGSPMSHGCINMRNPDAKWLFRWVTPTFELPVPERGRWDARGYGTRIIIE